MKIVVTGGAGFIASHIVDAYISQGHNVVVVDDLSTGKKEFVSQKARFYQVDIRDNEKIEKIFKKEKPEVLNHHAAQISVRNSVDNPQFDAEVNIIGLLNLLEAGRKTGVRKVIFASSGGVVYGEASKLPTPESYTPLQPLSPYGVTKLVSEHYLNFYDKTYNLPYVALRYANVYGPRQNPHGEAGVVAIFSLKLLRGEIPTINGDGFQTRDYIYVGDVVEANIKALETANIGAFNIGTGIETNVVEIFEEIKRCVGSDINANYGPEKTGEQKRSSLDNKLALEKLSWSPKVFLAEGIKKTVDYFRSV
ncbi:UDP-glucose 4-epimerase [Candidatus Gottesmanbacteria bacterium RIFCSPLOWO2_01_FULL_39_12b]|uniref:UDP-glucose 4-epimerase n=1 Tax=Candidatus Gottesmanbacteria bacterium RIFCSPLOWO2_01_FULL_39_12b TaxID=1798388 RepID=A0A1F6AP41_9BACT|nr:MAG: UDP-glucose 4-epimerase [Candidatus Gottesmanbacteria bacterium RIFCSPLOWO2_01_FULL_39_12b]